MRELSPDPALPDLQFVRTRMAEEAGVFVLGLSIKGVFDSCREKELAAVQVGWPLGWRRAGESATT